MKRLGRSQWLLLLLFLLVLIVTGLFAVRAVRRAAYWHEHRDESIRPWMSVRYVARSYRVPPPMLYRSIGAAPIPRDRRPLREIAREQNRSVDILISELQQAIVDFRKSHSPPDGPPLPIGGPSP
jgi:hypothetical protein